MLSRIAEALFWIGRYVERADNTARILDVHLQLVVEDPEVSEDLACRSLLTVMGSPVDDERQVNSQDVLDILTVDRNHAGSIAHSIYSARENARRAREILSAEIWECLNTTLMRMPRRVASEQAHRHYGWVRERSAMALGLIDSTTSRDEAWLFFTLGRSLERADMTARIIAARQMPTRPSWTTTLWASGAYEGYLRTYRGAPKAASAAEFLLLDRLFPRSVMYSLKIAEDCLRSADPSPSRVGFSDAAIREVGKLRTSLEYLPVEGLAENVQDEADRIQTSVASIATAIHERYFESYSAPEWTGDRA